MINEIIYYYLTLIIFQNYFFNPQWILNYLFKIDFYQFYLFFLL